MNRRFSLFILWTSIAIIAMVLLAGANTPGVAAQKIVIKAAHDSPVTYTYHPAWLKFKEVLEAETNGAVEVQIFPDAQLGDEQRIVEGMNLGTIDAGTCSTTYLSLFGVKELEVVHLPYIFRDVEHMYKVWDGPTGQRFSKLIEQKANVIVFGWGSAGIRDMWNSKRPIQSVADLKGLKMRATASPIMIDMYSAFGAQSTTMPFGEIYSALQQKVIDGADNDFIDLWTSKFYEVTKYVSETEHMMFAAAPLFSKKVYDKLSPEIQMAVMKAGCAMVRTWRKYSADTAASSAIKLKEKGLKFYTVDKESFKKAVRPVWDKWADKVGGWKAIEEIEKQ